MLGAAAVAACATMSFAATPILAQGNSILAFDSDASSGNSSYPSPGETPQMVIDGATGTKYLNFGNTRSGFIVIPSAPSVVQSFRLSTANDAPERDPFSYSLFG